MPHQNRVTPFSTLIATPERGTLNGNRGCLHDASKQIVRNFRGKRWIICLLEFKGRKHPIMKPGLYTDLFFLDEATALAAGHRPCAECQRGRYNLYRECWAQADPSFADGGRPSAPEIDEVLHRERTGVRSYCNSSEDLPDGTMLTFDESDAYLVLGERLYRWTPGGFQAGSKAKTSFPARILTPESSVKVLKAGYPVGIHQSAAGR